MKKILVIDDDLEVQAILRTYLEREGFEVFCSSCSERTGAYAESAARSDYSGYFPSR